MKREFFGTSVEDALQRASLLFGVEAQQLEYSVVEGEFGRLLEPYKVVILVEVPKARPREVTEAPPGEEAPQKKPGSVEWAIYILGGIFKRMGVPANIESKEKADDVILTVELPDGTLDLRRGESRELRGAIQHLVNRAVSGDGESEKRFIVDIGGTLLKRREKMNELAKQLFSKVSEQKKPVHVHLMDSQDRRIVHTALAEIGEISSMASGEAQFRVLLVEPKKKQ